MYEIGERVGGASVPVGTNVLISGPPLTGKRQLASSILGHGRHSEDGGIVISTRDTAERLRATQEPLREASAMGTVGIVDCVTRSMGRQAEDSRTIKYVASPKDMTSIGLSFSEFIEYLYGDLSLERIRVVVDSVSTFLVYSKLQTVFQFLHSMTSLVRDVAALGVYVVESTAHDEATMNTIRPLFDGHIEVAVDGSLDVDLPAPDESIATR